MQDPAPRRARPGDASAVAALTACAYAKYVPRMGREPEPMTVDYAEIIVDFYVWILGDVDGVLVLKVEPDHLLIWSIAVDPAQQGCGLGRRLMAFAEDEARRLDRPELRLYTHETMTENIALYTRLGYQETERRREKGFERVFMRKALG
jgi:ribosomal protein S18 acetylase RimI-like enzyme